MAMPPGFRFHPTDEELVAYYLKKKVAGRNIEFNIIGVIDLYKQEPWDLPDKSLLKGSDAEWYFFSPRDKKYPNGLRTNRATEAGYWKATGKDRNVKKKEKVVGMKKTLVFYMGRAPHGERTDWVMHEYRLDEEECEKIHASQDLFVLCRVFKKNGVGPRSGEDRGPQTYVDDDLDQEPSGTFADALRKALEPREDPGPQSVDDDPDQELSGTFADTAKTVLEHESIPKPEREAAPVETPNVAPVDSTPIPTPILSVSDYRPGDEGIDRVDVPTLEGYGLDDKFVESEEDEQFWETFLNAPEFGLPPAPLDGSLQQLPGSEGSELFEAWQGDRETNGPCGMMWNRDLGGTATPVQQEDELIGADGYADALQIQLLESHDRLPPLEEERESSGSPNGSEHRANVPDFSENVNQQSRGRGPARARSRAARQQPTFEEVQQRARSSNDGLYGDEAMSPRRMFNMLLRGHEVASQAREDTTSLNATWPASVGSAANNFDNNQAASSSSASAAVVDNSGVCSGEEDLFSFHDPLYDFAIDDELMNAASYEDDNYVRSPLAHELTGNQGSSSQPAKPSESVDGESAPSSSAPEGSSGKSKPVSKPLAGLMKLLGSMPALPASAAEYPSDRKTVQSNEEVASTFSCIHVSAVTVTCTSSGDGAQKVQAAVTDCRLHGDAQGMYQQVVSGSWQTIPEGQKSICAKCDSVATGGLQRRVTRGSNSGFVFVFVLGAVSALCWFLLIRCMLRLVRHVVTSVF